MPREKIKQFIKRRPSWFWWTLLNALAAAFAVASWSVCLVVFNFPEHPRNYELLRKWGRLQPVDSYQPLDAPDGTSADPAGLLQKFYALSDEQLAAHNRHFKRNYLTNFKEQEEVSYVEGIYRVTRVRALTADDFFHPGLAIRAHAIVLTDEYNEPSLYPVVIELLLPFDREPSDTVFPEGHLFDFKKLDHRALILHAAKTGSTNEPTVCLTVVPLAFENYRKPDGSPLPLATPDPLNMRAPFPAMEENRAN